MNNENVLVSGIRLRLVPYLPQHVPRYHQWMKDGELLQNTSSEPITLEEEYANQREWLCASDKLTFILLAPLSLVVGREGEKKISVEGCEEDFVVHHTSGSGGCHAVASEGRNGSCGDVFLKNSSTHLPPAVPHSYSRSPSRYLEKGDQMGQTYVMIGDCNLFHLGNDETDDEVSTTSGGVDGVEGNGAICSVSTERKCFEVTVMIAERSARGLGFGEEAVRLLMSYALDKLNASCFIAKILKNNIPSVRLFADKLDFGFLKEVAVFDEVHYYKRFDSVSKEMWKSAVGYKVDVYNETVERRMTILQALP